VRRAIFLLCLVGLVAVGSGTYRAVQDARRADPCDGPDKAAIAPTARVVVGAWDIASAFSSGTVGSAADAEDQMLTPQPLKLRISPADLEAYRASLDHVDSLGSGRKILVASACSDDRR
jgi:hypothetical protein